MDVLGVDAGLSAGKREHFHYDATVTSLVLLT
jgi:hypothetical protein